MLPIPSSRPRRPPAALLPGGSSPGRWGLITLLLLAPVGCATAAPTLPAAPPAEEIPTLEREVEAQPRNARALLRLGAAQRAAGDTEAAVSNLETAASIDPTMAAVHFFLALAYEDQGRPGDAIEAYRQYQDRVDVPAHEREVEGRIRVLQREQLHQAVRDALSREGQLAAEPPGGNSVAVFPFLFAGGDESLRPLSRALAAMLITDLSQTNRLRVLERLNVQALIDEMALGESGLVDPGTAARSGYLLGAGNIVQGRIEGDLQRLALDAAVVQVTDQETGETSPLSQSDAADELFAMETQLALDIYETLGISLTPAERELVSRRPTENLQAVLAWGRGLEASDEGNYAQAAAFFRQAAALDPDFEEAQEAAQESETVAAVDVSTDQFEAMSVDEMATSDMMGGDFGPSIPDFVIPEDIGPRDPAPELDGGDRPVPPAILIIRAGGGEDR